MAKSTGEKITIGEGNELIVPNKPIIAFIEGHGIGADITRPMMKLIDTTFKSFISSSD